MQDITELQRRLTSALDRIGSGLEGLSATPETSQHEDDDQPTVDTDQLIADLDAERAVTAQLEERLHTNKGRTAADTAKLQEQVSALQSQLAVMEEDRARLKTVNDALRDSNQALREANEAGTGEGALINTALQTELDALRQVRRSDRAELDAVLGILSPVLEAVNAQSDEVQQDA